MADGNVRNVKLISQLHFTAHTQICLVLLTHQAVCVARRARVCDVMFV